MFILIFLILFIFYYFRFPLDVLCEMDIDMNNMGQYFGMAKVVIEAPRKLHLPVLPMRTKSKLLFALCRACAEAMNPEPCTCSSEDRRWLATLHTNELQLALQHGYVLHKVVELLNYPPERTVKFNKDTGEKSLFSDYIDCWLQLKQESSGFLDDCVTEPQRAAYIERYKAEEGIELRRDRITKNPGLRFLSKQMLNSYWGKFGELANKSQTGMYTEGQMGALCKVLGDPTREVTDFHIQNDVAVVSFKKREVFSEPCPTSNLMLAATTTSSARCRLYKCLDIVQDRNIYCDTDSIIYLNVPGKPNLETGHLLGQLVSELKKDDIISRIAIGGPKAYAYQTLLGDEVCKVRGFTLNHANSRVINFNSMRKLLMENPLGELETCDPHKIKRDKDHHTIYSCEEKRTYRMVQTKRIFNPHTFLSVPYGTCSDD